MGCRVPPTGAQPDNLASIIVTPKREMDFSYGIRRTIHVGYELEYEEYRSDYDETLHYQGWDYFILRSETFYSIPSKDALEALLARFLGDLSQLIHLQDASHPRF